MQGGTMRCRRCNGIQAEATGPEPSPPTAGVVAGVVCARCGILLGPVDIASRLVAKAGPLHFIFHTGHVGSTLVSRLLDETGVVLSLREPLPLRTLADAHDVLGRPDSLLSDAQFQLVLGVFMRLWARGYDSTRGIVVKATSSAGRLAVPILAGGERSRAIYMSLSAEPYLAGVGTLGSGSRAGEH